MATRLPGRAFHPPRYADANDPGGPARARAAGAPWIDYDFRLARGRQWINLHATVPALEGFRFTAASIAAGVPRRKLGKRCWRPVRTMRLEVILTLRTNDGRRIQTAHQAFRRAADEHVAVEADVKVTPTRRQLQRLAAAARVAYGDQWREKAIVKRSARIPGWRKTLRRAKAEHFTTAVLRHNGADLPRFVDHFRP